MGGPADNGGIGAAWVFTRDDQGLWTQPGPKLVGAGYSVALSGDGNTAIVGDQVSGAWVFTRDDQGLWTQQGQKLVGTGAVGNTFQGWSVALSGDGNTAIVGGPYDNSLTGAAWVFIQPTIEDCKNGGWLNFVPSLPFTNRGQCVSYFAGQQ